jgi:hypothetical protein
MIERIGVGGSVLNSEPSKRGPNLGTCTDRCATFLGKMFNHNSPGLPSLAIISMLWRIVS